MTPSSLHRALVLWSITSLAIAGCAADGEDNEHGDVGTDESGLVAMEYDEAEHVVLGEDWPSYLDPRFDNDFAIGGFYPSLDTFVVQDLASDGRSVGFHWRTDKRRGICRNKLGFREGGQCTKRFPQGERLEVRMGRCDGTRYTCRTLDGWTNWTEWKAVRTK